jgi:hypothetical protein
MSCARRLTGLHTIREIKMNLLSQTKRVRAGLHCGASGLLALALAGCSRNEIKVYRVAKEAPPSEPAPAMTAADPAAASARAPLTWTLPAGWQEAAPGPMRAASFFAVNQAGLTNDISVIPLPSGGPENDLVNMWRQQLNLPPVDADAAGKQAEPVAIGSDAGKLFDLVSTDPVYDGKLRRRILVAMTSRGPTSWFFKMTGEDAFVREQKPAFVQFLKSVSFPAAGAEQAQFADVHRSLSTNPKLNPGEAANNSDKPSWVVPAGWQEMPGGQFLVAKFLVPGSGDAKAELNVGTAMGGVTMNVNRWRGQLGLAPLDEDGINKSATMIDVEGGKAMVVDFSGTDARTGQPARLIGAIVAAGGQTWFYKFMGSDQVITQQKDTFTKFVQTVKYPHAP